VRKAQVKLAAYYLTVDEREKARTIFLDMESDPSDRLVAIREELERVETKDFWEIIDRGRNFEFMPPPQKEAMRRFFTWFEGVESTEQPEPLEPTPSPAVVSTDAPKLRDTDPSMKSAAKGAGQSKKAVRGS
jgi:hypothetical protein